MPEQSSKKKKSVKKLQSKIQSKKLSKKKSKKKNVKLISLNTKNISKYMPISELDLEPEMWELPNRKSYFNWFYNTFGRYGIDEKLPKEKGHLQLFRIQRLVKNFFQYSNPNRGILLYHGLGFGKSCAAISITQSNPDREVIFLSKASLEPNFVYEIKKCGVSYMRSNNYWVFSKCANKIETEFIQKLNIPSNIIKENKGVFFIDFEKKESNYNKLTDKEKDKLNKQLNATIYNKFKFYHLDDTRIINKIKDDDFDNKIIIVDEVHNLINSMSNETVTGEFFYKLMMNSKNSKYVFLSGTPIINSVFESVKMFNILHGKIQTIIYKIIVNPNTDLNWNEIKTRLTMNIHTNQIIIDTTRKLIKVTQNPDNFINYKIDKSIKLTKSTKSTKSTKIEKLWDGIKYSPENYASYEEFRTNIDEIIRSLSKDQKFKIKYESEKNTILPENEQEFERLFFNTELNKIKNKEIIRKRISGLTSYYDKLYDKSVFPEIKRKNIVLVPMSEYQLGKYKEVRNKELLTEKNQAKRANSKDLKSSFRIYSRLYSSFVFPEEIGNPYEKDIKKKNEILSKIEDIEDIGENIKTENKVSKVEFSFQLKKVSKDNYKKNIKENQRITKYFMEKLYKEKDNYLTLEKLYTYSPKYKLIIENILKSEGSCFLYSQFINIVGLRVFSYCLEATNEFEEFKINKVDKKYKLILKDKKYDNSKKKYIIFAGDGQDKETKEILRLIFNSDYESLPPSCNFLIKQLETFFGKERNKYGKIVKLFMTTRTGAEGISLYCVRQVHIMEPYWQPVLIDQVIGRARRMGSHKMLKPDEQNVEVFVYMSCFSPEQAKTMTISTIKKDVAKHNDGLNKKGKMITSDEFLYILSERKKTIINEFNLLIMESAFDCTLNYVDNIKKQSNIKCLDYDIKKRDEYLYTPNIEDTIDIIEIQQEFINKIIYLKIAIPKGSSNYYYINEKPIPGERRFLYSKEILNKVGSKPIGEIIVDKGKKKIALFKKK